MPSLRSRAKLIALALTAALLGGGLAARALGEDATVPGLFGENLPASGAELEFGEPLFDDEPAAGDESPERSPESDPEADPPAEVPVEETFEPIGHLQLSRIAPPEGELPRGDAAGIFAQKGVVAVPPYTPGIVLAHAPYGNVAPYCRPPLYFEDVNLERYGCTCCCECLQPLVSAAHFGCAFVTLPYRVAAEPPCECIYTLNYYPPDECAPVWCRPREIKCGAAAVQAAAVTGLFILIP